MLIPKKKRYLRITTFPLNVLPPDIDALISGDWSERWCNRASEDISLENYFETKFRIHKLRLGALLHPQNPQRGSFRSFLQLEYSRPALI